jgi:1,2-dihydroxy-3-keto-5-methylthiopentene dioxygenase
MHEDEEIRYVLSGSGYFDVRGWEFTAFDLVRSLTSDSWQTTLIASGFVSLSNRETLSYCRELPLPILCDLTEHSKSSLGIYHRFTLDERNAIQALRLFQVLAYCSWSFRGRYLIHHRQDEPKWTAYNRGSETESSPFRHQYLRTLSGDH